LGIAIFFFLSTFNTNRIHARRLLIKSDAIMMVFPSASDAAGALVSPIVRVVVISIISVSAHLQAR
jgi:hypothetical protein